MSHLTLVPKEEPEPVAPPPTPCEVARGLVMIPVIGLAFVASLAVGLIAANIIRNNGPIE